jgi:hypothetical protein
MTCCQNRRASVFGIRGWYDIHQEGLSHMAKYSVSFMCNECLEVHPMGIVLHLENGPPARASIGDAYAGKELPTSLAILTGEMITCPNTGRLTAQRDTHQVFLVPIG